MNKGFLILVGIIFVAGLIYLNGQVADACTHGNCVHGWDSKYTKTEQANYRLWFFGFPITIYILYKFFNSDKQNNSSYQEKVDYLVKSFHRYYILERCLCTLAWGNSGVLEQV